MRKGPESSSLLEHDLALGGHSKTVIIMDTLYPCTISSGTSMMASSAHTLLRMRNGVYTKSEVVGS